LKKKNPLEEKRTLFCIKILRVTLSVSLNCGCFCCKKPSKVVVVVVVHKFQALTSPSYSFIPHISAYHASYGRSLKIYLKDSEKEQARK
jgi:hypothetical protein